MTEPLFRSDAYARQASARVVAHTAEGGIVLDGSIFYPAGGGQPGDAGQIVSSTDTLKIATTMRGPEDQIVLIPAEPRALPAIGQTVQQRLDWDLRYRHMRLHTALHLLSVILPYPVTGGNISARRARLDFDMPEAVIDRETVETALAGLIAQDAPVSDEWITEAQLDANPGLVKTMSVQPPRGAGRIRLVRIGSAEDTIDLQPCGGTHVCRTSEIGAVQLGKIEKKGRQNRRVYLNLAS